MDGYRQTVEDYRELRKTAAEQAHQPDKPLRGLPVMDSNVGRALGPMSADQSGWEVPAGPRLCVARPIVIAENAAS